MRPCGANDAETWLLTAGGAGCFATLIAACVTTLWPDSAANHRPRPSPAPNAALHAPHLTLSEEDKIGWLQCDVCIALVFLALLLADLVIRRRIASSRN